MITKAEILKMVKSVTKRSRGIAEAKTIDPHREWFIGIGLFVIVVSVGGVMATRNYLHYSEIEGNVENDSRSFENYRGALTLTALEKFQARKAAYDALAMPLERSEVSTTSSSTADSIDDTASIDEQIDDENDDNEGIDAVLIE